MTKLIKSIENIENEFFELDHDNKIANMYLSFNKPSDIFDNNAITKTKVLSDDFIEWIKCSLMYAPRKYKINLHVEFDDMEEYSSEELKDIFIKNTMLEAKRSFHSTITMNKIAISLIIIGIILFGIMLSVNLLWKSESVAKQIISYVMDIGTTVTFWEALTILIVQNKERGDLTKDLLRKFGKIEFMKKD